MSNLIALIDSTSCAMGQRIVPAISDAAIASLVLDEKKVVVLKSVFPSDALLKLRDAVFAWGKMPASIAVDKTNLGRKNYQAIERGVSAYQKTLHNYHAYNLNQIDALSTPLSTMLLSVFDPMRDFHNRLTGSNNQFEVSGKRSESVARSLHPQVIQYPRGGGLFASHVHPFEPQKIGLILAISKRGVDFKTGGAGFEYPDGTMVDTSDVHDIGDMILFRYDLRHWVSFVDLDEKLDYEQATGRWSAVLPYY